MLNHLSTVTLVALMSIGISTAPVWAGVRGRGVARGTGSATGQIAVSGQGQAQGTGIVVYRDDQGQLRSKRGTGSVSGQGVAFGRGSATATGTAIGRGQARGQGRTRSF